MESLNQATLPHYSNLVTLRRCVVDLMNAKRWSNKAKEEFDDRGGVLTFYFDGRRCPVVGTSSV
jgi:hypothetical protein